ncbi:MAG: amino acid ABC transporter permease [Streptococcaceae bacterium]|jgi:polar amino acid transport system permease protein|nr:amino acid ABC transporter permease [Streptococcaceae bacterium]
MKKHRPLLIGLGVLVVILLALILPFLIIPGKYSFNQFWNLFFTKIFSLHYFGSFFLPIVKAIPMTFLLTIFSGFFGLLLGLLLALVRINKIPVLDPLRALFVSFIRGTPIIVQLLLTYTGIPLILQAINLNYGTNWNINGVPTWFLAILAFSLNEAAYNSETIRAAIQSVDTGQIEAAKSLGMTGFQVFLRVTLPEAARVATAPLGNSLIGLLKGTSLAFSISVVEMYATAQIIAGQSFRQFEAYIMVALVYWAICIVMENLIRWLERALAIPAPPKSTGTLLKESLDPFAASQTKLSQDSNTLGRFQP